MISPSMMYAGMNQDEVAMKEKKSWQKQEIIVMKAVNFTAIISVKKAT